MTSRKCTKCQNMSKYNATIDAIKGFDRILPEESQFYRSYKRSVNNVNVIDLINILSAVNVCCGVSVNEVTNKVIYHVLQVEIVENDEEISPNPNLSNVYQKNIACLVLIVDLFTCEECSLLVNV